MFHPLFVFVTLSCFIQIIAAWSYTDIDEWYVTYPICASATQSPINFRSDQVQYRQNASTFLFHNYDTVMTNVEYDITNNGHTAVITLIYASLPKISISGGDLSGNFSLFQFHLHWGSSEIAGSEHTVDGAQYPAELHFVHLNSVYNSTSTAINSSDGVAVLGIFVQIGSNDNPAFNSVIDYLRNVSYENQVVTNISSFVLRSLFPSNTNDYYRYKGSLTTPPCYNSVIWTVFRQPVVISLRQINAFRDLHENLAQDPVEVPLVNNFRTVQPLNGRLVYRSFDNTKIDWNYNDTKDWDLLYPNCGGLKQSPINIVSSQATSRTDLTSLTFTSYSQPQTVTFINTGYSIDIMVNSPHPSISGGGLTGKYNLFKVTLHWGALSTAGSEHTLDSSAYPLEVQLLHYNDQYGSSGNASEYPQGLAMLSVFVQISSSNANFSFFNTSTLQSLQYAGSTLTNNMFILQSLLPADTTNYYRYNGSLTTPRCLETVVWTVFTDTLSISPDQLNALQKQVYNTPNETSPSNAVGGNDRPVQSLNNRTVYRVGSTTGVTTVGSTTGVTTVSSTTGVTTGSATMKTTMKSNVAPLFHGGSSVYRFTMYFVCVVIFLFA